MEEVWSPREPVTFEMLLFRKFMWTSWSSEVPSYYSKVTILDLFWGSVKLFDSLSMWLDRFRDITLGTPIAVWFEAPFLTSSASTNGLLSIGPSPSLSMRLPKKRPVTDFLSLWSYSLDLARLLPNSKLRLFTMAPGMGCEFLVWMAS